MGPRSDIGSFATVGKTHALIWSSEHETVSPESCARGFPARWRLPGSQRMRDPGDQDSLAIRSHREPGESDSAWAARLNDAGVVSALIGDKRRATAAFTQALDVSGTWYSRAANNLEALGSR